MASHERGDTLIFSDGYTIYRNPKDAPGKYVLRGWRIEDGKSLASPDAIAVEISDEALSVLRETMQELGLTCLGRVPEDDPVIVETWMM
jgi:hypothetical protein